MYVSGLWEVLFVLVCISTCSGAARARPTLCDPLQACVYLRALPLDVRTQSCLVFVSVHRYIICIYI